MDARDYTPAKPQGYTDSPKAAAPEHHSRPDHKRVWRFLTLLLSSCAECGTQDADYFARVPPGHLTYCADDELCPSCAGDHGIL
jgi:hypothetical protein